jgi:hypothetical protein
MLYLAPRLPVAIPPRSSRLPPGAGVVAGSRPVAQPTWAQALTGLHARERPQRFTFHDRGVPAATHALCGMCVRDYEPSRIRSRSESQGVMGVAGRRD